MLTLGRKADHFVPKPLFSFSFSRSAGNIIELCERLNIVPLFIARDNRFALYLLLHWKRWDVSPGHSARLNYTTTAFHGAFTPTHHRHLQHHPQARFIVLCPINSPPQTLLLLPNFLNLICFILIILNFIIISLINVLMWSAFIFHMLPLKFKIINDNNTKPNEGVGLIFSERGWGHLMIARF